MDSYLWKLFIVLNKFYNAHAAGRTKIVTFLFFRICLLWAVSHFRRELCLTVVILQVHFRRHNGVFPIQGCADHRERFPGKWWKKELTFFCYRKISKYSSKHSRNFYPTVGNTSVTSVLYLLPLFCFGQFVFNVMSSYNLPIFLSHYYRAASPVVTERWAL